ncbi:RNA 2',3'-cyclic phosphodiesterase [Candidatus Woesearchaeota archaeon]|nr:RNA 2',3'-cyclic phosphodiesterase [Candidatus Woesearchaeota archaeon]
MRTFIAVEVPEELKKYFVGLQKRLEEDAKIAFSKDFHLTLKFLGEIHEDKVEKVKNVLKEVEFEGFKLKTSEIGVFPNEDYVRVVWVGLEPGDKIKELQRLVDDKLKDFPNDHKFHPHITLGRVKFIPDKNKFKETLKSLKIQEKEFEVKDFRLKKSILTPEGPVYEDLKIYEF